MTSKRIHQYDTEGRSLCGQVFSQEPQAAPPTCRNCIRIASREPRKSKLRVAISARIDADVAAKLEEWVKESGERRSHVIEKAIAAYLEGKV